eukprot:2504523-Alexandrium_andersonii.AAC.1
MSLRQAVGRPPWALGPWGGLWLSLVLGELSVCEPKMPVGECCAPACATYIAQRAAQCALRST